MLDASFNWFKPAGVVFLEDNAYFYRWQGGRFARPYQPLRDHTALFLEFSGAPLEGSARAEKAISLLEQYGVLKAADPREQFALQQHFRVDAQEFNNEMAILSHAVYVWESIRSDNLELLKANFGLEGDVFVRRDPVTGEWTTGQEVFAWESENQTVIDGPQEEIIPLYAKTALLESINKRLAAETTTDLTIKHKKGSPEYTYTISPKNLLGAIWAQFSEAVREDSEFGVCSYCGKRYKVNTRRRRLFCSNRCKVRTHREV